nr:hypothetical protein [Tanacetum cinerariifolium]
LHGAWFLLGSNGKVRGSGVEVVEWRENRGVAVVKSLRIRSIAQYGVLRSSNTEYCQYGVLRHLDTEYLGLLVMDVFDEVRVRIRRTTYSSKSYNGLRIRSISQYGVLRSSNTEYRQYGVLRHLDTEYLGLLVMDVFDEIRVRIRHTEAKGYLIGNVNVAVRKMEEIDINLCMMFGGGFDHKICPG